MEFEDLIDFIDNRMEMAHNYQLLMLRILVETGGTATIRQLAHGFLAQDESQLRYYESKIEQMPLPVLRRCGVIKKDGELVTLNCKKLTFEQKAQVVISCEKRLQRFNNEHGIDLWGSRLLDTDPVSVPGCKFCFHNIKGRVIKQLDSVVAVKDGYPVTEGHTLVIPKRHAAEYFDLSDNERRDADSLMKYLKQEMCNKDPSITGYNIGLNNGESAGQTIFHVHYHLIPRRDGDTENPRGGVRGVIPGKRSY